MYDLYMIYYRDDSNSPHLYIFSDNISDNPLQKSTPFHHYGKKWYPGENTTKKCPPVIAPILKYVHLILMDKNLYFFKSGTQLSLDARSTLKVGVPVTRFYPISSISS